jgi:CheY-like chemotaxis protein
VLISRGQRRNPRAEAEGIIMIDGNALAHQTCTEAVAIAAGRRSPQPEERTTNIRAVIRPALSREAALRQGRLILVAEDNPINQIVIQEQLNLLGYAADVAQDGPEAFQRWQCEEYGLLFTDLHMPKMDGYDLTMAIRTAEKGSARMPIVALTANALPGEAERCRAVGMDDYLSKPASLATLSRTLDRWLPETASAESDSAAGTTPEAGAPTAVDAMIEASSKAAFAARAGLTALAPPVDRGALEALVGSDPDVIQEVLKDFSSSAARLAAELATACALGDTTNAGELSHRLKSSARAVGAARLGELCASIEDAASANRVAVLAALIPRFDAEMAAVQAYLRELPDPQSACA